jgi:NAD(P)-dependent dehydrogenase (short-subunit alcohol dehydrogenase family)
MLPVGRPLPTSSGKKAGMCVLLFSLVGPMKFDQYAMGYRRDVIIQPCREAVSIKCDVTQWDEQVALFELAMARFDAVDIVVSSTVRLAPQIPPSSPSPSPFPSFMETPCRSLMQASTKAKKSAWAISSSSMASPRSQSYIRSR